MIPDAFRIDHGDGAVEADAQAVRLGAIDLAVLRQVEFDEPLLEVLP